MRYEFIGGTSKKFWEIFDVEETAGDFVVRVKYGRIGTAGQENIKVFSYESGAKRYHQEKVAEKLHKGYKWIQPPTTKKPIFVAQPVYIPTPIEKPKPFVPLCPHFTLTRKNGVYECTACKKKVEFDKPQVGMATPEFETKVRRYFEMG